MRLPNTGAHLRAEFVNGFRGRPRRGFLNGVARILHGVARIAEGST